MFDFVRTHQRHMLLGLLILVFPSFVFFGVQSYAQFLDSSRDAAKVGGTVISTTQLDTRVNEQIERLRRMLGAQYDPRQFEGAKMRKDVLDGLIEQRVLAKQATRSDLTVPDSKVRESIEQIPEVQQLRKADGTFDTEGYVRLLASHGMTPEKLEARLRSDLSSQQLTASISATAFTPKALVDRLVYARDQQREVQAMQFRPADYAFNVVVDDKAIHAYYGAHPEEFTLPEKAKVEYVVLSGEDLLKQVTVSEEQIKQYYDQNPARFSTTEQRRAAHILIKVEDDTKSGGKDTAKKIVQQVLDEVRKNPATFADLAKKYSGDPGSASQRGELGFLGKGATVAPFENALFALKQPGDISDVVESQFGFHIIKLEEIKPGGVQPMATVREDLERQVRRELANKKYRELADTFTNLVEDRSESLQPVADKFKIAVSSVDNVTRTINPGLTGNPVNNAKVLKAVFTDDVLRHHKNTQAIQVDPNTLLAARVVEYRPASTQKLADALDQAKVKVLAEQSAALAKRAGEARLAEVKQHPEADGFGAAQIVSRKQPGSLLPQSLSAVMCADTTKLPTVVGVDLGNQGYVIYRVNKVLAPANPNPSDRATEAKQLDQIEGQTALVAYKTTLKTREKVKINQAVIETKSDGGSFGSQ